MVLGETEITGQVKTAYETARTAHLTGPMLNRVFQKAFQTVKEIRTQTSIGRGATSVGSVAVELAERIFRHDLSQHKVMIIGAGQLGETCVRHFAKKGARSMLVSNRSFDRAIELARQFGGEAVRFEECLEAVTHVDHCGSGDRLSQYFVASWRRGKPDARTKEPTVVPNRHRCAPQHRRARPISGGRLPLQYRRSTSTRA